jgi:hypothetical protein
MAHTVTNPGARLAGLFADLGHKIQSGTLSEDQLALFLKKQNPFTAPLDKSVSKVALVASFVTANFFVTKRGLYVYDSFKERIIPTYQNPLRPRSIKRVKHFDLHQNSYDKDILARVEMGGMDKVRARAFMPDQIAALIKNQLKGPQSKSGPLLTNGFANIFYTIGVGGELFAVRVRWSDGKWRVGAHGLDGYGSWYAGRRVFSN